MKLLLYTISGLLLTTPCIVLHAASTADTPATAQSTPLPQPHDPRYQLRKGDSFEVELPYVSELNEQVAVQPDGFVTLKEIGSIHVEGKTIPELTATLTSAYATILRDPVVTVSLKDFERPYFLAGGQVGKPGKYDLRTSLTVTQAVAIAGGFNENARRTDVLVFHRTVDGLYETKVLNAKKLVVDRNMNEDIYLSPGDMIFVQQSTESKVRRYLPSSSLGTFYNPAF